MSRAISLLFTLFVMLTSSTASADLATAPTSAPTSAPSPATSTPPSTPTLSASPFPTVTTPAEPSAPRAGYKKGFFIRGDDFALKLGARVQALYTAEILDDAADENHFTIPRARLTLAGHAFSPRLTYYFQTGFGKGEAKLKDFFFDFEALPSWIFVRVGQWKMPFSRQHITSSSKFDFIERAITHKAMGIERDIGVAIHNDYYHSPRLEYLLGIFNGTGAKSALSGDVQVDPTTGEGEITGGGLSNVPDHLHPALMLRLAYNHGGIKSYEEMDFEGGPLRFALGGGLLVDFDSDGDDASSVRAQLDYILKLYGFASSGDVFWITTQDGEGFGDQAFASWGFRAQAGYLFAKRFEVAARYALVDPDGADNNRQEIMGAIAVYFYKHGFKWQSDAGALISETGPDQKRTDVLVRSQLQLAF